MTKKLLSIEKLLTIFSFFMLISCNENFQKLPEKLNDDENLLKQIKPSNKVVYWQLDYINGFSPSKIFENGNKNLPLKIGNPKFENMNGFFTGCQPLHCNYRILYIENGKWNYVTEEEELKKFIGKIDNEYEAFLIARINDYEIDRISKGNGFEKREYGYKLKVMKYNSCPETKQAFILTIDKSGNLKIKKDLGYYLKTNDCIKY